MVCHLLAQAVGAVGHHNTFQAQTGHAAHMPEIRTDTQSGFFLRRQRQFACFPMPLFVHCCFLFSDSFRRTSLPAPKCRLDLPYCTTIWSFFSLKFFYFSAATHRPRRKRNSAGDNTIFRFCFSHNFRLSTQIRRASAVTAPFHRRPGLQAVAVEQLA